MKRRSLLRPAIIHYGLDRAPGGIGRYTIALTAALRRRGTALTILHAGDKPKEGNDEVCLPAARRLPGLLTLGQVEIGWQTWRKGLGLIHDPTGTVPLLLVPAGRVATIHDVIPYRYPETSTLLDQLIYRCWLPVIVRRLHRIITDSECSKQDIVRYLPIDTEQITVIPLAADAHYRPLEGAVVSETLQHYQIDSSYILYVGSLESRKNLPRLLRAYAHLRHWSSTWKLVIVGARKWKFSPIFDTVQQLGLEPHVHFTGYVEEADLPALYNGADCFAFPSLYEGFGLPVLEAMACGTPVVTSNVSSLPEVAGDAAILIDPYDVEQIAHALWLVLSQPILAAALREKGLVRAAQFTWERTARETAAVYEQVLG